MKVFGNIFGFLLAASLMFFGGFFARDAMAGVPPNSGAFQRLVGSSKAEQTPTEAFQHNYNLILSTFGRKVAPDDLRHGAMTGLVSSLGDPHTNFLEPKIAEAFSTETRGDFVGVGARLQEDPLGARIFTVFPDGPAKGAGLKANDVVTEVDGKSMSGLDTDKVVTFIRGEAGTPVVLTVVREGHTGTLKIKIIRRKVEIPTVESRLVAGDIGYVQVTNFAGPTTVQFQAALQELSNQNMKGLVIDMRENPGGLLSTAADMLSLFVSNKPVVTMKGRGGKLTTANTKSGLVMNLNVPVAILVNENSASAAEIFSGVMRDYKKATLVGSHTYGKASVQDLFTLPEGATAKITIAKYLLPSGDDISRTQDEDGQYLSGGIRPAVPVEFDLKPGAQFAVVGKDSQLDKAISVLRSQMPAK